jgi:hypothetical protein
VTYHDDIPVPEQGEEVSADWGGRLVEAATRETGGAHGFQDATGFYPRPIPPRLFDLVGGCLAEDHPGRSIAFKIYLGTWNSETSSWDYDLTTTVYAIDHRYDMPYPDEGATGLFVKRASDTYGVIYECVSLDCSSPGACS